MSDGRWMPVQLVAEWRNPREEETVNVGPRFSVIALYVFDQEPDESRSWASDPSAALIIRPKYMGSHKTPMVEHDTEWVMLSRIRLLGFAGSTESSVLTS